MEHIEFIGRKKSQGNLCQIGEQSSKATDEKVIQEFSALWNGYWVLRA